MKTSHGLPQMASTNPDILTAIEVDGKLLRCIKCDATVFFRVGTCKYEPRMNHPIVVCVRCMSCYTGSLYTGPFAEVARSDSSDGT